MKNKIIMMLVAVAFLGLETSIAAQDGGGRHVKKHKNAKETVEKASKNRQDDNGTAKKDSENKRENNVDKRQANQEKRIQQGIDKGYLTPEETKSLQDQQNKIAAMESTYKADGKLTKDEMSSLRDSLNVASANIWAEKHNADGKQMPVCRLGKDVYAKDSFTGAMANQNMTGADAKALTGDFRKMLGIKNSLANDSLTADQRAQKQTEYNDLLNKYFEVR